MPLSHKGSDHKGEGMEEKIEAAIRMLEGQGHTVKPQLRGGSRTMWFEIDGRMLASWQEMQDLADGVYSLPELEDLYERRQAEEQGK
jgi:hypothetical protein